MTWRVVFTKRAQRDAKLLVSAGLKSNAEALLTVISENPCSNPPRFENLVGDLTGAYSCRINIQHRLVYEVFDRENLVRVLRMWTHYE